MAHTLHAASTHFMQHLFTACMQKHCQGVIASLPRLHAAGVTLCMMASRQALHYGPGAGEGG